MLFKTRIVGHALRYFPILTNSQALQRVSQNFFLSLKYPALRFEWNLKRKALSDLQQGYECDPFHPQEYRETEFFKFVKDRISIE